MALAGSGARPGRTIALPLVALSLALAVTTARAQGPRTEPPSAASAVRDPARLFETETLTKARADLAALEMSTGCATLIETSNGLGDESIEQVAARRARAWGGNGFYVLIDKKDRKLEMILSGPARTAVERPRQLAVRDAFLNAFRGGHYDEGLVAGVKAIGSALLDARKEGRLPAPDRATPGRDGTPAAGLVLRNQVRLTLEGARRVIAGAEARAAEIKQKMNIAVVDDGGHLLAFERMDGARPASGYTAITKATTAATFRQETGPLPKGSATPDVLLNLSLQNAAAASGGKVTTLFGGVPVLVDGQVIGAVGVGGGTGEQDADVAKAGIARFLADLGTTPAATSAPKVSDVPKTPAPTVTSRPVSAVAAGPAVIPHGQSRPPNPPLSPEEAVRKMTVPKGFSVEVVASEPDIINPVAMTFDERGRVWVTESLEYPRHSAGPGRDRVKVLEDTDGDGKADKFTVFAEGLNIPSGVAVGHGGVWVANAPDILFLQDTDGDGKADRREVVVTGFGRDDTHELPNTLAWGPDGWLYGWNGVFNQSHVTYKGKTYDFTCAIFRIHPKTRDFELFCEGTSNPWGIAWDVEGNAFASACVIDHLWHLTETGYYHRQGGPYPPFTWEIGSIVDHSHEKAAYCGIHYYDSDAYPPAYRGKLFMGNIHGNSVNVDSLRRRGSTYEGRPEPDLLDANDAWFMPVSQKTGPDGSLYVLDWYDRYHCYQDANRDPAGIDRLKGRLYRIRYQGTPRRAGFDLARKTDAELIDLLGSPNGFDRETARRLLSERPAPAASGDGLRAPAPATRAPRRTRLNAVWTFISRNPPDPEFLHALLSDPDPGLRAWGVRAAGETRRAGVDPAVRDKVVAMANDPSPDVLLQVAIAARKLGATDPVGLLARVTSACGNDPLIPRVVWPNLHPLLDDRAAASRFVQGLDAHTLRRSPALVSLLPHAVERLISRRDPESVPVERVIQVLAEADTEDSLAAVGESLRAVSEKVQSGEVTGPSLAAVRERFTPVIRPFLDDKDGGYLHLSASILATSWKDPRGYPSAREAVRSKPLEEETRLEALNALLAAGDAGILDDVASILSDTRSASTEFRGQVLGALGRLDDPKVAQVVLDLYPRMAPELQPRAVELLTQRTSWGLALLNAVGRGVLPASALNVNQVRKLLASNNPDLVNQVKARWGTIREGRDKAREAVIRTVRDLLRKTPGDPQAGAKVFQKVCAQCHKIYGEGQDVGPEITRNGRGSYDQLLSNVFDPSLVIGSAYQGTTVATADGRVLTGLLVERSPSRVVLKMQGGKVETIPGPDVEELKTSSLSLMPEDLERQIPPQELADLFAFLTLDKPPNDPAAKPLPGAQELARESRPR